MLRVRVIPVLLLKGKGLVKTVNFKKPTYIGDPINAVKIFNDKEVDELIFLDINATKENKKPNEELLKNIASEAFMPFGYGGGISDVDTAGRLLSMGVEKVILNTVLFQNPEVVKEMVENFGSQSVIGSVDVKEGLFSGPQVYSHAKAKVQHKNPVEFCKYLEQLGIGEICLNSVDRDGTLKGYDLNCIKSVSKELDIPLIACGGAGSIKDMKSAVDEGGASAVAAGSLFVYHGKYKAVLINFPSPDELEVNFAQ
jgi:cyclase